jgi:hypothetical protein
MDFQPDASDTGGDGVQHIDEHACLDLLQGLLSPAEETRVLEHISDCAACEDLFRFMAAEHTRIEAVMAIHTQPDGEIVLERRGTAAREKRGTRTPIRHPLTRWWEGVKGLFLRPRYRLAGAVAVAVAIMICVLLPQFMGPSPGTDLQMLPLYAFTLETRGVGDVVPMDLTAGLDAYQRKDFDSAVDFLTRPTLSDLDPAEEAIRQIFLGSALAWTGEYERAADVLRTAGLEFVPGQWGREAKWTLYVSLRESGQEGPAASLLHALAEDPGDVGERARRVLQSDSH